METIKVYDFNNLVSSDETYGGQAGAKLGVILDGENWFLKFPNNLKEKKDIFNISYSNSPLSEYLGSHFYSILGIPVHETILGIRGKHLVVLCKDFRKPEERLQEFKSIKTTYEGAVEADDPSISDGSDTTLSVILGIIDRHPIFRDIRDQVRQRFWDMFVVDALISNYDRNNGNWGVITNPKTGRRLSPVYDNGNSFFDKWEESKFAKGLQKSVDERERDFTQKLGIFKKDDGERINPYKYILQNENMECSKAVLRLYPRIENCMDKFEDLISAMPLYTDMQKQYIIDSIRTIENSVLRPAYNQAKELFPSLVADPSAKKEGCNVCRRR